MWSAWRLLAAFVRLSPACLPCAFCRCSCTPAVFCSAVRSITTLILCLCVKKFYVFSVESIIKICAATARALFPHWADGALLIECAEFKILPFDLKHAIIMNPSCLRTHLMMLSPFYSLFFFSFLIINSVCHSWWFAVQLNLCWLINPSTSLEETNTSDIRHQS